MARGMSALMNLPGPFTLIAFIVVGGGGIALLLFMFVPPRVAFLVFIAIAVIGIAVFLVQTLFKALDKRKSKPFEDSLSSNAGAAPSSVSDPSGRAKLDDLRKKFDEGVRTFKDAGKDLYSLPWYMIVGEPGSGKTEAIRHCNVGFPPGLQDQLQGAGGTVNMNWWFTNHAVILDTAGRLVFENVQPGQSSEWKEFLKLLRSARPNCPVNGLMLAIPADSLLTDSANDIEAKAGKLAQQLDHIQRSLGVRFPVFILITKSDKLTGFREFFDDLTDPILQMQMLGWSNPNDLDVPFSPEHVEQHLAHVSERLRRRRLGLLVNPVHSEDPNANRIEEVDELYAFPDAISQLAPRLRKYLEMVFVAGEWSQKPLFLRGIYFTSAMREGDSLDIDLANALGVAPDALPDGKTWTRDRSYFLKDLFTEKVFRERGLVTTASNTRQLQRRRQGVLLAASLLLIATLGLMTWFGNKQLEDAVGGPFRYWDEARSVVSETTSTGEPEHTGVYKDISGWVVYSASPAQGDVESVDLLALLERGRALAANPPRQPWIFLPVRPFIGGDLTDDQQAAVREMFEDRVLGPAVALVRDELVAERAWDMPAVRAYAQLLRLEKAAGGGDPARIDVDVLFRYLVTKTDPAVFEDASVVLEADLELLGSLTASVYPEGNRGDVWPPARLGAGTSASQALLEQIVEGFVREWGPDAPMSGVAAARVRELRDALAAYDATTVQLIRMSDRLAGTRRVDAYRDDRADWQTAFEAQRDAFERLSAAVEAVSSGGGLDFDRLAGDVRRDAITQAEEAYETLLGELEGFLRAPSEDDPSLLDRVTGSDEDHPSAEALSTIAATLSQSRTDLVAEYTAQIDSIVSELRASQDLIVSTGGVGSRPSFVTFHELFALASGELDRAGEIRPVPLAMMRDAVDENSKSAEDVRIEIERVARGNADDPTLQRIAGVSVAVTHTAERRGAYELVSGVLEELRRADIAELVRDELTRGERDERPEVRFMPRLAMTSLREEAYENAFQPEAARRVLSAISSIRDLTNDPDDPTVLDAEDLADEADRLGNKLARYADDYILYWTDTVPSLAMFEAPAEWDDSLLRIPSAGTVAEELEFVHKDILAALELIVDEVPSKAEDAEEALRPFRAEDRAIARGRGRSQNDVVASWSALLRSPAAEARIEVLNMTPGTFADDYWPARLGSEDDSRTGVVDGFWQSFGTGMLDLLVKASTSDFASEYRQLVGLRGFPLCLDDNQQSLSPRDVERASQIITGWDGGGGVFDRGQIGGGAVVRGLSQQTNRLLEKLRPESVLPSTTTVINWQEGLGTVARWLRDAEYRLVVLGASQHVDQRAYQRYPRLSVEDADGNLVRLRTPEGAEETVDSLNAGTVTQAAYGITGSGLRLRLTERREDPDSPFVVLPLDQTWGPLIALRRGRGEKLPDGAYPGGPVWRLDLPVPGMTSSFSIGVQFVGDPPPLDVWPTLDTWPAAGAGG